MYAIGCLQNLARNVTIEKQWRKFTGLIMNLINNIRCGNTFANVWNFKRLSVTFRSIRTRANWHIRFDQLRGFASINSTAI